MKCSERIIWQVDLKMLPLSNSDNDETPNRARLRQRADIDFE